MPALLSHSCLLSKYLQRALISVPTALESALCSLAYRLSAMTLTAVPNTSTLFPASDTLGLGDFFFKKFCCEELQRNRAVAGEGNLGQGKGLEGAKHLSRSTS